mmetsp:Transcript_26917/g.67799  ORF Transcript_26917/g.67799 Transcript_26917/m.67799 type:complete len:691 (+) Transcript_26917:76-2148(+)
MERVSVQQLQTILRDAKEIQDSRDFTDLVAAYALQHGFSSSFDFIHFVTPLAPRYEHDLLVRLSSDEYSTSERLRFLADGGEGGSFYVLSEDYSSRLKYTSSFLRWRVVDPAGVTLYDVDSAADWDGSKIVFGNEVELHRGNWLCLRVRKSSISLLSLPVCVGRWILVPPEKYCSILPYGSSRYGVQESTRGEGTSLLRQNAVYQFLRWSDAFWRPRRECTKFRASGAPLLVQLQRLARTWLRKRIAAATSQPHAPATASPQQQPVAFADALQLAISRENEQAAARRAVFLGSGSGRSKLNFLDKLPEEVTLKILGYVDVIELLTNFGLASRSCRALLFDAMQNKGASAELQNLRDRFRLVLFCKRVAQLPRRGRKLDLLRRVAGRATDTESETGGALAGYSSVVPLRKSSHPEDWIDSLLASPLAGLRSMLVQALSQLWSDAKGEISLHRNPPYDSPPRYTTHQRYDFDGGLGGVEEPFPRSSDAPESAGLRYGLQLQLGGSNSKSIQPARASYHHCPTNDRHQLRLRLEVLPYDCARAFCLDFDCFYRHDSETENVRNFPDADLNSDGLGDAAPPWISSIVEVLSQRQAMCSAGFLVRIDDVDYLTNSSRSDLIHARQAAASQLQWNRLNDLMMRNVEDRGDEDEDREENGDGEDDVDGTDGDGGIPPGDRFIFTGHGLSQYTNLQLG